MKSKNNKNLKNKFLNLQKITLKPKYRNIHQLIASNKAQSSVEFLTTYGWIMMVVLLAIGVLINYGFFNLSRYLPENVDFGQQLRAEEFFVDSYAAGTGLVALRFRNNFARDINITGMRAKLSEETNYIICGIDTVNISVGRDAIIACPGLILNDNVKNNIQVQVTFRRDSPGTTTHNISGIIFAEPTIGEYCLMEDEFGVLISANDHVRNCGE